MARLHSAPAPPALLLLRDAAIVLGVSDRVLSATLAFDARRRAATAGFTRLHELSAPASTSSSQAAATTTRPSASMTGETSGSSSGSGGGGSDDDDLLAACLFLACKTCEEARRLRDVINALHVVRTGELLRDSREYWSRKERLIAAEQSLLRLLGFDTAFDDHQVLLLNALRRLSAPVALYELCIALLNDSAGAAAASGDGKGSSGRARVAGTIGVGAELLGVRLAKGWCAILEVEPATLTRACDDLVGVYGGCATRGARRGSRGPRGVRGGGTAAGVDGSREHETEGGGVGDLGP
jgi:hypothetical protein